MKGAINIARVKASFLYKYYLISEELNSLLELLISPAAQAMQEKQQMGFPLITACRKPGIQLWLHTDCGLYYKISKIQNAQMQSFN